MAHDMLTAEERFWTEYLDTDDQIERLFRWEAWRKLLTRVWEAGYQQGVDEGGTE